MMLRLGSALMLLSAVMFPAPAAAQGRTTYCCTDDGGKQTCSDVLPKQCYGRAYREINAQGTTVVLVEQNALMALSIANRGYVLQTGSIALTDDAAKLKKNEMVQKTYLGIE